MQRATRVSGFATAHDAESAFYEAFERGDLGAMMSVWADDEEVVCIHPGGTRLIGYEQVRKSYAEMFDGRERVRVHLSHQVYMQGMLIAVHSVLEHVLVSGEPKPRPPFMATNVYMRTSEGWRMLMHHASAAPAQAAPPAETLKRLH